MITRTYITFLISCLLVLAACSKNDDSVGSLPEKMQQLTNGNYKDWQLEKVTYYLVDVSSRIPECQRDEIYRFYTDGKGEVRSGDKACLEAEPAVQATGTWKFNSTGDTMLVQWKQQTNWKIAIDKLNPDQLVTTGQVFDNYEVTATFRPL